jgi:hypothetical protein
LRRQEEDAENEDELSRNMGMVEEKQDEKDEECVS